MRGRVIACNIETALFVYHRIDLVADKKEYAVGDTAEVLVPAPFKDAEALLKDLLEAHESA